MSLVNKRIVVGLGGGIAAFKTVELARILMQRGAEVRVAMTESAQHFIGPTTFSALTGHPTAIDLWDKSYAGEMHIDLAQWADAIVVAPATADLLARAVAGMANDVLLATLLCANSPVLFAPAMHERMWLAPSTQRNLQRLLADGANIEGPVRGLLANGQEGMGRMQEPALIADAVEELFAETRSLSGKTILVSAGPTIEDIDPVRFISNRSSGRMGYAIAQRACRRGARVILVSGPVSISPPGGVEAVQVRSAVQMHQAVKSRAGEVDAIVMTAAVADYRPVAQASDKIKKQTGGMTIELERNPDILAELGKTRVGTTPILVGFAMETRDVVSHAEAKLKSKRVDLIVANEASVAFGGDHTQATLVSHEGNQPLAPMSKRELAERILDWVYSRIK
ncbi:MAG: bifunctional phosphopantothenoylcysteine decarboxylase/phosphopantothenate--cysteine ligase CoaBC [Deltaproteobacteria bacterium]|nr:bifunctional phosphopantothenoylcysteine decarboxylase/phosphopantothenate--cysteine ligase CoaBC [Deltaproteobacteria bacterium]